MSDFLTEMLNTSNLKLITSKNTLLEQGILHTFVGGEEADLFIEFGHILKVVTDNYNKFVKFTNEVNKKFKNLSDLENKENDFNKKCEINQFKVSLILSYPIQIRIYLRTIFIELRTLYYMRKEIEKHFDNKLIKRQIMNHEADILNIRDSLIHIDKCLYQGKSFKKIRHENGIVYYYSLKDNKENNYELSKVKKVVDLYNNLLQEINKKEG